MKYIKNVKQCQHDKVFLNVLKTVFNFWLYILFLRSFFFYEMVKKMECWTSKDALRRNVSVDLQLTENVKNEMSTIQSKEFTTLFAIAFAVEDLGP